jgi:hypothetical protein
MDRNDNRDSGLRVLGLIVGAIVVWTMTYSIASVMLHHSPASARFRAAAVMIGDSGFPGLSMGDGEAHPPTG